MKHVRIMLLILSIGALSVVVYEQDHTIQQQRQLIRNMTQIPACMGQTNSESEN